MARSGTKSITGANLCFEDAVLKAQLMAEYTVEENQRLLKTIYNGINDIDIDHNNFRLYFEAVSRAITFLSIFSNASIKNIEKKNDKSLMSQK